MKRSIFFGLFIMGLFLTPATVFAQLLDEVSIDDTTYASFNDFDKLIEAVDDVKEGGTITFGAKTYNMNGFSGSEYITKRVELVGRPGTVLTAPGGSKRLVFTRPPVIRGITFDGWYNAIEFEPEGQASFENVLIEGCYFNKCDGAAITRGDNSRDELIESPRFINCKVDSSEGGILLRGAVNNATVTNCEFRDLYSFSGDLTSVQAVMLDGGFPNWYAAGQGYGNHIVTGNIFEEIRNDGTTPPTVDVEIHAINVKGINNTVSNNVIDGMSGVNYDCEPIRSGGSGVRITGNIIRNYTGGGQGAILLKGGVDGIDNLIAHNILLDASGLGVRIETVNATISNNVFVTDSIAIEFAYPASEGHYATISGNRIIGGEAAVHANFGSGTINIVNNSLLRSTDTQNGTIYIWGADKVNIVGNSLIESTGTERGILFNAQLSEVNISDNTEIVNYGGKSTIEFINNAVGLLLLSNNTIVNANAPTATSNTIISFQAEDSQVSDNVFKVEYPKSNGYGVIAHSASVDATHNIAGNKFLIGENATNNLNYFLAIGSQLSTNTAEFENAMIRNNEFTAKAGAVNINNAVLLGAAGVNVMVDGNTFHNAVTTAIKRGTTKTLTKLGVLNNLYYNTLISDTTLVGTYTEIANY